MEDKGHAFRLIPTGVKALRAYTAAQDEGPLKTDSLSQYTDLVFDTQ